MNCEAHGLADFLLALDAGHTNAAAHTEHIAPVDTHCPEGAAQVFCYVRQQHGLCPAVLRSEECSGGGGRRNGTTAAAAAAKSASACTSSKIVVAVVVDR